VGDEAFAGLLAVVADVDPAGELLLYSPSCRLLGRFGQPGRIDRLAAGRAQLQPDERRGARQASRVGGENAGVAALQAGACCFLAACQRSSFSRAPFFAGSISFAWLGILAVSSIT
jgi:hypothetical protein